MRVEVCMRLDTDGVGVEGKGGFKFFRGKSPKSTKIAYQSIRVGASYLPKLPLVPWIYNLCELTMAFDGTDGWETFVVKMKPDKPEQFIYCFKPPNIHNPAEVMAKEIANMFETKFPKTWAALTNRSVIMTTICGDGAPVVSKTVDELRKYPQFFRARYSQFFILWPVLKDVF